MSSKYGAIPWKGAWGGLGSIDTAPDAQPAIGTMKEGAPHTPPARQGAVQFLIEQVHAHPHEVTIVAAGPLTNLALAIREDPTFAETAKQLIFMGGMLDTSMMSITGNADFASDFNMIFDPEAAHITLTAPWKAITVVGSVSNDLMLSREYLGQITSKKTPLTTYIGSYYDPLPMWDEMTTAIAADPTLVTAAVDARMDIDTSRGPHYGHAFVVPAALAPKDSPMRVMHIVRSIDEKRFRETFAHEAQTDLAAPRGKGRACCIWSSWRLVSIPLRNSPPASRSRSRRSMTSMAPAHRASHGSARACIRAGRRKYSMAGQSTA